MSQYFDLLTLAFELMSENKLREDIDDTLLEKLLTFIEKFNLNTDSNETFVDRHENNSHKSFDFIEELFKRTKAQNLIEKVLSSIANRDENYSILIKVFTIRLLGLVFLYYKKKYPYENLLPLLKSSNKNMILDYNPSIQDAILYCLSCITKHFDGAKWFIEQDLKDFVFHNFNSSSYYVRKSSVCFIADFISQWMHSEIPNLEKGILKEEIDFEKFIESIISYIISHIHFYKTSKEKIFSECCISIIKQLLEDFAESLAQYHLNLTKKISDCFIDLPEDTEFNKKLTDLFLTIHLKFHLSADLTNDSVKCLILKENMKLAMDLASSYISMASLKPCTAEELTFLILPLYILMSTAATNIESFYTIKSDLVYNIMLKQMEEKSECKALVSSSLTSLQKIAPMLSADSLKIVEMEIFKLVKNSDESHHKWLYSVLEDRMVHNFFTALYSSLISVKVHCCLRCEESDLVFQSILEFLKKPSSDCNFLSQMLLLMKDILILHEQSGFKVEEADKSNLIQMLYIKLHDNREAVVDSAIHLAGQMMKSAFWQINICEQGIHSVIWDIAILGNHDGTVRSTALKVIIESCIKTWCMSEMTALKSVTEMDIFKILFDLTFNPDFFLQREALSCLYKWVKLKWNDLQPSSKEYLFSALVTAMKSLDLELKILSLDVWLWLLENKFIEDIILPTFDIEEFTEYLTSSGFGISMMLAIEDYDVAVQFKAANILNKLKGILMRREYTFNSLTPTAFNLNTSIKCEIPEYLETPLTKEEKDEGIENVLKISTTDQITNICCPVKLEQYNFKQEYFPISKEDRRCSFSLFWTCLWSEKVTSILQSPKADNVNIDVISVLNDIISARILEYDKAEDTPDCY